MSKSIKLFETKSLINYFPFISLESDPIGKVHKAGAGTEGVGEGVGAK